MDPPPEHSLTVSPDGRLIAYTIGLYASDQEIVVANADGTNLRQVTNSSLGSVKPVFSPMGDRIYFFRERWPGGPTGTPVYDLWEVRLDGTPERMLYNQSLFSSPLGKTR
jgi:Tol biopolymer transport system component